MKHVYPVRHPASLDATPKGSTTTSRDSAHEPSLPHEQDESSSSQASATPQHQEVGRKAYDDATDGSADTDKGPVMDKLYNEQVAPHRGPASPRH
ncbi:hypothetical protein [Scleromatobacter humisilvae]|uniref:Uncharacterized protein n=1 Tax=Scleromatobacter humisilvae TaxID=2897159 RepID=A0A9X1YGL3_9BURK|nr:hypothetical protein [Scleromatobacter humisilvae]MCK9686124.1 hypothetical protein [Scleromatobacter humisilvae]